MPFVVFDGVHLRETVRVILLARLIRDLGNVTGYNLTKQTGQTYPIRLCLRRAALYPAELWVRLRLL